MDSTGPQRDTNEKKTLSKEGLEKLLGCLDRDRDSAGEKLRNLLQKLFKFFEWRGSAYPEDLADETVDRLARKLLEGVYVNDMAQYALGMRGTS